MRWRSRFQASAPSRTPSRRNRGNPVNPGGYVKREKSSYLTIWLNTSFLNPDGISGPGALTLCPLLAKSGHTPKKRSGVGHIKWFVTVSDPEIKFRNFSPPRGVLFFYFRRRRGLFFIFDNLGGLPCNEVRIFIIISLYEDFQKYVPHPLGNFRI